MVQVHALIGETQNLHDSVASDSRQGRWSALTRFLPGAVYEFAEIGYNFVARRALHRAIHDFQPDLIYDRYNTYSTVAIRAAQRFNVPIFLEVNAPHAHERATYEHRRLRLARLASRYERFICNAADHVFAVSTPLKDFLVSEHAVPPSNITVLPNGVDPRKFDPNVSGLEVRKRLGIQGKSVIGFAGILRPWHGLDLLLGAFRSLVSHAENAHLLIVGDGPMEASLKEQVQSMGLMQHVSFTGRIPHDEMHKYMAAMDIAVSPRATFYASPMKILEYMAMGVATVAPDTANIRDLLRDGEDSKLFAQDDQQALQAAILTLLCDLTKAKELGIRARKKTEAQRSWLHVAYVILQKFETLADAVQQRSSQK